jgi:hypothetical protein
MTYRVLVCGGRAYQDRARVKAVLDVIHICRPIDVIIHGDATGADTLAKEWAEANGIIPIPCPADWDDIDATPSLIRFKNGKPYNALAGFTRNQKMLDLHKPDLVVGFPGGTGTGDMMARAKRAGIERSDHRKEYVLP